MSRTVPENLVALLTEPNFGTLGVVRADDTVQVNPMWFEYDGEHLLFTHTAKRQKFRNLQVNPSMTLAVFDPHDPYHYIEVRGHLERVEPDPTGAFFVRLAERYGTADPKPPADSADRIVLVMAIDKVNGQ